ncbi:hypothetical protein HQ45_01395 [Porphyromonas crevioricanis]|nr:hypothetical protein HQ45_01395 [Porphyromonas crevioricanis]
MQQSPVYVPRLGDGNRRSFALLLQRVFPLEKLFRATMPHFVVHSHEDIGGNSLKAVPLQSILRKVQTQVNQISPRVCTKISVCK